MSFYGLCAAGRRRRFQIRRRVAVGFGSDSPRSLFLILFFLILFFLIIIIIRFTHFRRYLFLHRTLFPSLPLFGCLTLHPRVFFLARLRRFRPFVFLLNNNFLFPVLFLNLCHDLRFPFLRNIFSAALIIRFGDDLRFFLFRFPVLILRPSDDFRLLLRAGKS